MTESIPMTDDFVNVRSDRFWIALTTTICPRCAAETAVAALAVPAGHETLQPDDEETAGPCADLWSVADCEALLFHLEFVPARVADRIRRLAPGWYIAPGAVDGTEAGSNHCAECGFALHDQDLFCEPGGAFSPVDEAHAGLIRRLLVEAPFAAAAGGYAPEPAFWHSMRRG